MSLLPNYSRAGKAFKTIFFIASLLEILLFSGITYGWAAIVVVFKEESFFADLCPTSPVLAGANSSTPVGNVTVQHSAAASGTQSSSSLCPPQDERFNLVFTIAVFSLCGVTFPIGIFVDRFGPRASRVIGGVLYCLGCLGFAIASKDTAAILFPVFILFCVGGAFISLSIYQMSNLIFTNIKSFIICFLHGAFDSSAVVLVFVKLAYDSGYSLKSIGFFYLVVTFMLVTVVTAFLVPKYSSMVNKTPAPALYGKHSTLSLNYIGSKLAHHRISMMMSQNEISAGSQAMTSARMSLLFHDQRMNNVTDSQSKNGLLTDQAMEQLNPCEPQVVIAAEPSVPASFWAIVRSPVYILELMYLSIVQLRLWYFIGSLNSYLVTTTGNDKSLVNRYSDIFGYVQLCGIVVAPLIGFAFDRKILGKSSSNKVLKSASEERLDRLHSAILPFLGTNVLCIAFSVMTLFKHIEIMIPCFVLKVVVRGFLYGAHGAFIGIAFPPQFYGRLYGFAVFIAGVFGLSQYGLFVVTTKMLGEDPFWMNIGLLILVVVANIHPLYLWIYCRRLRKQLPS